MPRAAAVRRGMPALSGALRSNRFQRLTTGVISYASRLMFSRWRGEMLSDVMLPPYPPQPSVIAGSRPVVSPIDPCVVGVLTTMRKAGFLQAELEDDLIVLRMDRHGVAHAAVPQDLLAALAALRASP